MKNICSDLEPWKKKKKKTEFINFPKHVNVATVPRMESTEIQSIFVINPPVITIFWTINGSLQ